MLIVESRMAGHRADQISLTTERKLTKNFIVYRITFGIGELVISC